MPTLAINKRAKYDYNILQTFEAGLVLTGQEVKSVKLGHLSLKGAYVSVKKGELYLINAHISPYKYAGSLPDYEPTQHRKLLLKKQEIKHLIGKIKEKGLTLVPIKVYTKHNRIKLEFGVGQGKKLIDKRETIKKREEKRKMDRMMKYN